MHIIRQTTKLLFLALVAQSLSACVNDMGFTSQQTINEDAAKQYDDQWIKEQQRYNARTQPDSVYR